MSGKHLERSKYKALCLWADDPTHQKAIKKIKQEYEYLGILHDKDVDDDGELKKPHYHFIVKMENTSPNSTLANDLKITSNYIQVIRTLKGAVNYLTHNQNPEKYQYPKTDIFGDLYTNFLDSGGDIDYVFTAITKNKIRTMGALVSWALQNNCIETVRKNAYLFSQILKTYT